jgi:hypothetical protein
MFEGKLKLSYVHPSHLPAFDGCGDAGKTGPESVADRLPGVPLWAAQLSFLQFSKLASDFFQPILSGVIICLGSIAGVRLSPIQFVGAMDNVELSQQDRDSCFPPGFGVHR